MQTMYGSIGPKQTAKKQNPRQFYVGRDFSVPISYSIEPTILFMSPSEATMMVFVYVMHLCFYMLFRSNACKFGYNMIKLSANNALL